MKIVACQLPYVHQDIDSALGKILEYGAKADSQGARLVCYPECYLQGYVFADENTERLALNISSGRFDGILKRLAHLDPILVIGLIEADEQRLYYTAVIVKAGKVLGRYRKTHLRPGESMFDAGSDYPVFEVDGLRFGINICNDLNFPNCAKAISDQKAGLLVCPCNNMMGKGSAEVWKHKHNEIRAKRAVETSLWLVSSDVTGDWAGRVSFGPTAVIDPNGSVVEQVQLLEEGLVLHEIAVEKPVQRVSAGRTRA